MKFINKGESIKIRKGQRGKHKWHTLKTGETMDLPSRQGKRDKLEEVKVTEGQIGSTKVETKQIDYTPDDLFFKELTKIDGIGSKTAKDIIRVYETKEELIIGLKDKGALPFRDDIELKLRKKYD